MLKINSLKILNGKTITYEALPGDIIRVLGANGSGKSLFLKTLARLLPKESGGLIYSLKDSSQYAADLWRSKILYLPPEVSYTEDFSLDDFLSEPFTFDRYKDFKPTFQPRDYLQGYNSQMKLLSSGQRQKVALLRALALDADVLLLDESFSHMDQVARGEAMTLLKKWVETGKILFIVTHFEMILGQYVPRELHL